MPQGGPNEERTAEALPMLGTINLSCSELCASETFRLLGSFLVAREGSEHPAVVNVGSKT